jgi:hypothetical protein
MEREHQRLVIDIATKPRLLELWTLKWGYGVWPNDSSDKSNGLIFAPAFAKHRLISTEEFAILLHEYGSYDWCCCVSSVCDSQSWDAVYDDLMRQKGAFIAPCRWYIIQRHMLGAHGRFGRQLWQEKPLLMLHFRSVSGDNRSANVRRKLGNIPGQNKTDNRIFSMNVSCHND